LPWIKTIVGDVEVGAPVSMYAIDESRMDILFLVKGNSEDISCKAIFNWALGICVPGICQAEGVVVVWREGVPSPSAAIEILV
jgi:hypothetical protein